MHLIDAVVEALALLKRPGTVDDVMPLLPGEDRKRVLSALHRATDQKRITCQIRRGATGRQGGALPSLYQVVEPPPRPVWQPRSSVWDLARAQRLVHPWPPAHTGERRVYVHLTDVEPQEVGA